MGIRTEWAKRLTTLLHLHCMRAVGTGICSVHPYRDIDACLSAFTNAVCGSMISETCTRLMPVPLSTVLHCSTVSHSTHDKKTQGLTSSHYPDKSIALELRLIPSRLCNSRESTTRNACRLFRYRTMASVCKRSERPHRSTLQTRARSALFSQT